MQVLIKICTVIDGNTIVVSGQDVANPVAVWHGLAEKPPVNLYNIQGLSASPFKTDKLDATMKTEAGIKNIFLNKNYVTVILSLFNIVPTKAHRRQVNFQVGRS
jgi:hypothetical protein